MKASPFWNDRRVNKALNLTPETRSKICFSGISTDSRSVSKGDLFVALIGDNFDGHDFISKAVKNGAEGLVVSRPVQLEEESIPIFLVEDTLEALGDLAKYLRVYLDIIVVAITGSTGKTGTKDLIQAAIEGCYESHCTRGNQNNRVGVPLTLLSTPATTEVVVLELGTNQPGEIERLTEIAGPQIAVITTVSESHTQRLKSLDGVMKEKLDLLRGLPNSGTALVGENPKDLSNKAKEIVENVLVIGSDVHSSVEYRPEHVHMDQDGFYGFSWREEKVELKVPGRHSVQNCQMALAVADVLRVPASIAIKGVGRVKASKMRMETLRVGNLTLILDCYNANPQSVESALEHLSVIDQNRAKVAFLGSMLELGDDSEQLHQKLLAQAMSLDLDLVVATGLFAAGSLEKKGGRTTKGCGIVSVADPYTAYEEVRDCMNGDEVVLLKASRGVNLEKLIPYFESDFEMEGISQDGVEI